MNNLNMNNIKVPMQTHKPNQWIVVLDSALCQIYDYQKGHLLLIKEISHPENKLKDIEITSDKPGRYQSKDSAHGAFSQETDPKEIKVQRFAKEIARALDQGRNANHYEKLIIVAAPHVHGLLFKEMNKHVKNLINQRVEKDLMHLAENDLLNYLNQIMKKH